MTFAVPVRIRRLESGEREVLRRIRLRALLEEPAAYCSTHARESAFGDDVWSARLDPAGYPQLVCTVGDGEPVGLVTVGRAEGVDAEPVAVLLGMWVDPVARGTGAADALVRAVVEYAVATGCAVLRLQVVDGNERAEGCYLRNGFRRTGVTSVIDGDGRVEVEMERRLSG